MRGDSPMRCVRIALTGALALSALVSCKTPAPPGGKVTATALAPDQGAATCAADRAVAAYLLALPQPVLREWASREMTRADLWVMLEFSLEIDGSLREAEIVRANPPRAGTELLEAMRNVAPFPPPGPARSCIAENRFRLLFRPGE